MTAILSANELAIANYDRLAGKVEARREVKLEERVHVNPRLIKLSRLSIVINICICDFRIDNQSRISFVPLQALRSLHIVLAFEVLGLDFIPVSR